MAGSDGFRPNLTNGAPAVRSRSTYVVMWRTCRTTRYHPRELDPNRSGLPSSLFGIRSPSGSGVSRILILSRRNDRRPGDWGSKVRFARHGVNSIGHSGAIESRVNRIHAPLELPDRAPVERDVVLPEDEPGLGEALEASDYRRRGHPARRERDVDVGPHRKGPLLLPFENFPRT